MESGAQAHNRVLSSRLSREAPTRSGTASWLHNAVSMTRWLPTPWRIQDPRSHLRGLPVLLGCRQDGRRENDSPSGRSRPPKQNRLLESPAAIEELCCDHGRSATLAWVAKKSAKTIILVEFVAT